ncbi:MAG: hypothetical protein QOE01_2521 [Actinomycetota bacterium]|nr:hypothetical protein [Actinomycetota bacterium]
MSDPASPPELLSWLDSSDPTTLADPGTVGKAAADLIAHMHLPPPGTGQTHVRLAGLAAVGAHDLGLARLVEGHADAAAICAELTSGRLVPGPGELWGVWAADPPSARVTARRAGDQWLLNGVKAWCSGADACSHALITAHADDGYRLFLVARPAWTPVDGTWPAYAMAASDSRSVQLDFSPAEAVAGPGAYLERPGFWQGGVGVAAVWYGGAVGVARALRRAHGRRPLDQHALAHAGAVDVALTALRSLLDTSARAIDATPEDTESARTMALQARAAAEGTAELVVARVGRALGATPLALDPVHGRLVADLGLYVRQTHAERDLADLGERRLAEPEPWQW